MFMKLVKSMLEIDPKKRPSAKDILEHNFFSINVKDETVKKVV